MCLNVLAGVWHGAGRGVLPPSEQEGESTDCPGAVRPHHLLPSCQIPWYTSLFYTIHSFPHISGFCKWFCQSRGEGFSLALFIRFFLLTCYHPLPCHPPSNLLDTEEVTHRQPSSSVSLWTLDILVFRSVPLPRRTPTETAIHSLPNPPHGNDRVTCLCRQSLGQRDDNNNAGKVLMYWTFRKCFGMSGMS